MNRHYGDRLETQLEKVLYKPQLDSFRRGSSGDKAFLEAVDVDALLKIMRLNYREVFFDKLGHEARNYVHEATSVRNDWAHQKSFTTEGAARALETLMLLLREVGANQEAEEVGGHLYAVRHGEQHGRGKRDNRSNRQEHGDRYEIKRPLGSGGMGEVYLARDKRLDRDVAVKYLGRQYARDPEFLKRFEREAKSAASLSHPNIVTVHDWGRAEDGSHYLVMEYLQGGSLENLIEKEGRLPASRAVRFVLQVAEALEEAHGQGMVHRDIKPGNVMLTKKGNAKVGDFGIARAAFSEKITSTDQIAPFTPAYASPEQKKGRQVDVKSDLYSLGLVFHEMLTGTPRSRRADGGISGKIPEVLREIIFRLLIEDPKKRPGARELIESLERVRYKSRSKPPTENRSTVEVPNLVGQKFSQARETLTDADLKLGKHHKAASETVAKDKVTKQEPSAGTEAKRGSAVDVRVSSGSPIVKVPNVLKMNVTKAKSLLASLGLEVREMSPYHYQADEWKAGTVIFQVPGAGVTMKHGGKVTIRVSQPRPKDPENPESSHEQNSNGVSTTSEGVQTLISLCVLLPAAVTGYEAALVVLHLLGIVELSAPTLWMWLLAPGLFLAGVVSDRIWGESGENGFEWSPVAYMVGSGIFFALLWAEVLPGWLLLPGVVGGFLVFLYVNGFFHIFFE